MAFWPRAGAESVKVFSLGKTTNQGTLRLSVPVCYDTYIIALPLL